VLGDARRSARAKRPSAPGCRAAPRASAEERKGWPSPARPRPSSRVQAPRGWGRRCRRRPPSKKPGTKRIGVAGQIPLRLRCGDHRRFAPGQARDRWWCRSRAFQRGTPGRGGTGLGQCPFKERRNFLVAQTDPQGSGPLPPRAFLTSLLPSRLRRRPRWTSRNTDGPSRRRRRGRRGCHAASPPPTPAIVSICSRLHSL
jgi:hypothetical protein